MKQFLLITLSVLFCSSLMAQDASPIKFEEVVNIENITAKDLYTRANIWLSETYNSSNSVIQMNNADEGIIIGKPVFQYHTSISSVATAIDGPVNYTIKISVKDGKYKCELSNFNHKAQFSATTKTLSYGELTTQKTSPVDIPYRGAEFEDKLWNDLQFKVELYAKSILESLKVGMNKDHKKENW
jgi:hypothetical protein